MKIVYMGTPDFAVGALEAIIQAGHEVTAVVTQPDRPKGRSKEPQPCPVKECAIKYGIPVLQPERIKRAEAVAELRNYPADIFVVAAFGQILSPEILKMPRYGCINIHASLLPKYRGAAPIQWAVINGERESGVTIMQMDEGLDTGDILLQRRITLSPEETGGSLFERLAVLGAETVVEILPMIERGEITPIPQRQEESDYARMLKKKDGRIDWSQSAVRLEARIRGLSPWPGAYTFVNGKQLKVWKAAVFDTAPGEPGTVAEGNKERLIVHCGEGALEITELQLEGKKRMQEADFLRGFSIKGVRLGE